MQLNESQKTALATLAENVSNGYDGLQFLTDVMELQDQGIDVAEELKLNYGVLTEDEEVDEDKGETDGRS